MEAYPWARRYLASLQLATVHDVLAAVPLHLPRPVHLIAETVECGWFVVLKGNNGTFSARQFAERWRIAAALPWLPFILQHVLEAEARERALCPDPRARRKLR